MDDHTNNAKEAALAARECLRGLFPKRVLTSPNRFSRSLGHAKLFMPDGVHAVETIESWVSLVRKGGLDPHDPAYTVPSERDDFSYLRNGSQ